MKIFSGSSNIALAKKIASNLNSSLGKIELSKFANGECRVWIKEKIEGQTVIVVQSFSQPSNEHIIEFLLIVDALYRLGADKILAVIPWMAYSPQDKVFRLGEPLSAKVIGSIISGSLVDRIFTFDIHNDSIAGFFSKPLEHMSGDKLFINEIKNSNKLGQAVIVSPDFGAIKRSRVFANTLGLEQLVIDKTRDKKTGQVEIFGISGSVKGKICLLFDDFISTGQTAINTAAKLKEWGAKKVIFSATHHFDILGVSAKLQKSDIDQVLLSDTIAVSNLSKYFKLKMLSTSKIIAKNLKNWI